MDIEAVRMFVKEQIANLTETTSVADIGDGDLLSENPDDSDERSLELDSLDLVELALELETEFEIASPTDMDFREFRTVDDVVVFVAALINEKQK